MKGEISRDGSPLFQYALIFLSGNVIAKYFRFSPVLLILLLLFNLSLICVGVIRFELLKREVLKIHILIQFFILGASLFTFNHDIAEEESSLAGKRLMICGRLNDISTTKNGFTRLEVEVAREIVLIYSNIDRKTISAGDLIKATVHPENISYPTCKSIRSSCYIPSERLEINRATSLRIRDTFSRWRQGFSDWLEKIITDHQALSIVKALTIGDKTELERELKDAYAKSGVMHLLALSGLHVGIIYSVISFILSLLGKRLLSDTIRRILIISALWFYFLLTPGAPSIMRAVIMATVYEISGFLFRPKNGLNALSISAIIICVLDPQAVFSLGFQLSFAAMLAIFLLNPYLKKCYTPKNKVLSRLWGNISISISCQLATTPFTLYYFNSFPVMFLLSNVIAIPLCSMIMILIIITLITSPIPYIGEVSALLLTFSIKILNYFIMRIG